MESFDHAGGAAAICEENVRQLLADGRNAGEAICWLEEHARLCAAALAANGPGGEIAFPTVLTEEDGGEDRAGTLVRAGVRAALRAEYARLFRDAFQACAPVPLSALLGDREHLGGSRFVYVRTPVADRAYQALARAVASPTVYYAGTFEDACGDVCNGRADFAILPLFGNGGESIRKTWNLLDRYELHIARCVSLPVGNDGEEWVFALLSQSVFPFGEPRGEDVSFAVAFHPASEEESAAMLGSAAMFGCRTEHAERVRTSYGRAFFRLVLRGGDREALLFWLLLSRASFFVSGIYRTVGEAAEKS